MEGVREPPEPKLDPPLLYTCLLMQRHSGCIIHEHATRIYFKKIWAELSYEFGPSCLINLMPSWHGPSFMRAEKARAELVLGRVVRNSHCVVVLEQDTFILA